MRSAKKQAEIFVVRETYSTKANPFELAFVLCVHVFCKR